MATIDERAEQVQKSTDEAIRDITVEEAIEVMEIIQGNVEATLGGLAYDLDRLQNDDPAHG